MARDIWTKEDDGVWRTPRYPKGGDRQHPDVEAGYDAKTNGAYLSVGGNLVELNFNELGWLLTELYKANQSAQAENSRLFEEKEALMVEHDGYVRPQYHRGRRVN